MSNCGNFHKKDACRAKGQKCNICHKIGHPGMLKMKLRAQQSMYWLGINKDIENHVMSCDPCQVNGRSQQKEPIILLKCQTDLGKE